jgi:transposase InsO family protein
MSGSVVFEQGGGHLGAAGVVHADQYSSKTFAQFCQRLGVTQSMGAVGTSADNALAESFNAMLKRETLQGGHAWPDWAAPRFSDSCYSCCQAACR